MVNSDCVVQLSSLACAHITKVKVAMALLGHSSKAWPSNSLRPAKLVEQFFHCLSVLNASLRFLGGKTQILQKSKILILNYLSAG